MKTIRISALVASVFAVGGCWAQQAFVGPALGVSVSSVQTKVDYESSVASINGQSTQGNGTDVALLASWGFAMSPNWVGTIALSLGLGNQDAGTLNYTAGGAQTATIKTKEHVAISFAPGYRVAPNALVYGKLAYHQVKAESTDSFFNNATASTNHTGTGIGVGAAFALTPQLELRAEYETVAYSSSKVNVTTGKPTQSGLNLALLYRF